MNTPEIKTVRFQLEAPLVEEQIVAPHDYEPLPLMTRVLGGYRGYTCRHCVKKKKEHPTTEWRIWRNGTSRVILEEKEKE